MCVIGYTIYGIGYYVGGKDYAWDPEGFTKASLLNNLAVDADSADQAMLPTTSKESVRVSRVVARLLKAAEILLEERVQALQENDSPDLLLQHKTIEEWETALVRLKSGEWKVIIVNDASPNAFVTPGCPRHIFVHKGLLSKEVGASDAALAFVLGHEISHTLLKHGDDAMMLNLSLAVATLAIVGSLDPTGVLTLGVEMLIAPLLKYSLQRPFSRECESEADALGMEICAKACYNPEGAHAFFKSLAKLEALYGGGGPDGWTSTHPRTGDRDLAAKTNATTEAVTRYYQHCIYAATDIKRNLTASLSPLAASAQSQSALLGFNGFARLSALFPHELKSRRDDARVSLTLSYPDSSPTDQVDIYWLDYAGDPHFWTHLSGRDKKQASCLPLNGAVFVLVEPDETHTVRGCFTASTSGIDWHGAKHALNIQCRALTFQPGERVLYLYQDLVSGKTLWVHAKVLGGGGQAQRGHGAQSYRISWGNGNLETVTSSKLRAPRRGARVSAPDGLGGGGVSEGAKVFVDIADSDRYHQVCLGDMTHTHET